jgi:Zinc knuckle
MLCYNCGQYGHRSDGCKNPRNADLVAKMFQAQGRKPCEHCGRYGHAPQACWSLPQNAHMRPIFQRGQVQAQQGQNMGNGHNGYIPTPNVPRYVGAWNQQTVTQHENRNMSIDNEDKEFELSFAVGPMINDEIESINDSLKGRVCR